MTATQVRLDRTGPALLLPLATIMILLGVALALGSVAPSRDTGGIYQVIVGEGQTKFTIPVESLSCNRSDDLARCTVPVAGQPLMISISYAGFDSSCRATRMVACLSGLGGTGQASHTVWISDSLGAAEQERAGIREATPWWRLPGGPTWAALVLVAGLSILAAAAALVLGRRGEEFPIRTPAAMIVGVLGMILFAASGLIIGTDRGLDWSVLISPVTMIAAISLGLWQYQLGGLGTPRAKAIGAALATTVYTATVAFVFLQNSGFIAG